MLTGAMDMSGESKLESNKYMAIVFGFKEYIQSLANSFGPEPIHMKHLSKRKQEYIISNLKFNPDQCVALCLQIDKTRIITGAKKMKEYADDKIDKKRINSIYNDLLKEKIEEMTCQFLVKHKMYLSDISFECDSDCMDFAKFRSLKHILPTNIHGLADAVAWQNHKHVEPKGCIARDISTYLEENLRAKIKRR